MRKRSHHQARLRALSSRQQELPFPTNVLSVLKEACTLMARRPALEHVLTALLESFEDAVLTVSPDGTIETWSPGAERLYGYTAREIVGQSQRRLLPLYELPQMERFHSTSGEKGTRESRSIEVEERLHKNGSRILVAIRRGVIRGDNSEAEGILEMAQALDPHEAFWSREEEPLRLLMEQVPGLLWTTDRNLKISAHWGRGLPAAKIRPRSLRGQDVREFLGVAEPHATPIAGHHSALRGEVSHFECLERQHAGDTRGAVAISFRRNHLMSGRRRGHHRA